MLNRPYILIIKMKNRYSPETSAELLLNYLYPDMADKWVVKNKGTFYRNYTADLLSADVETAEVRLSRDGILRLLPQSAINGSDIPGQKATEDHDQLRRRLQLLQEAFAPFDTFVFRRRLHIEREVATLLNMRLDHILLECYGYDRQSETNPYIHRLSTALPYVSSIRGNFPLIRELLASLLSTAVTLRAGRYSDTDNTRHWLPWARYTVWIDGLDAEVYHTVADSVHALERFVREWFIPFDTRCDLLVKQRRPYSSTDKALILDYNTQLK